MTELLRVNNLNITYKSGHGISHAVKNVSFALKSGQSFALVGESGCGKTTTANAVMHLLGENAQMTGEISFRGKPLTAKTITKVRGKRIAMIFQNPMSSLNPFLKIKTQLIEQIAQHSTKNRSQAFQHAVALLEKVGIDQPLERLEQYPHEFSGGMQQRVVIAMALSCNPYLIIADEPTTALDVTIQAQIIRELNRLVKEENLALLLISHDLGVVANICGTVAVMKNGSIVEEGTAANLFHHPQHQYTRELLEAVPGFSNLKQTPADTKEPALTVKNLTVRFMTSHKDHFTAVNDINFCLKPNEILGIAGESGSGKSTTLRALTRLVSAVEGYAGFESRDLLTLSKSELADSRQNVQMIFQDPYNSLNPRWRISKIIEEPLKNLTNLSRKERKKRVEELLKMTEVDPALGGRFPHQLSGGQCQRVGIARALATKPQVLLCDEPVSALDVVVQKQVIDLLKKLQKELNIAIIFVSHDLAVVSELCDRVLIMKNGEIVEEGSTEQIFNRPQASYTKTLISAVPLPDPNKKIII